MLLDSINNRKSENETESNVLGLFHTSSPNVNNRDNIAKNVVGENCIVSGKVTDVNYKLISGASLEVWQSGPDGLYDL